MKLTSVYRLDYPLYALDAPENTRPTSYDPDCWIEEQPLGLFFLFAALPNGLFVYIENDAEQICYEVRTAVSLTEEPNYFGFLSEVADNSKLLEIVDQELQTIDFGYVDGIQPSTPLIIGIKLKFGFNSLTFINYGDEGYYLFDSDKKYQEFLILYNKVFGTIKWIEQPQLLDQLGRL